MAGPKFTAAEREAKLEIVSDLYLKGKPQAYIAAQIGVKQQTVTEYLKTLHARWEERSTANIDRRKSIESAKIDKVEAVAWEAYERSCRTTKKTVTRKNTAGASAEVERERDRDGDPRFLEVVLKCVRQRCEIFGVAAPKEIVLTQDARPLRKMTDAELLQLSNVTEFAAQAAQPEGDSGVSGGQGDTGGEGAGGEPESLG